MTTKASTTSAAAHWAAALGAARRQRIEAAAQAEREAAAEAARRAAAWQGELPAWWAEFVAAAREAAEAFGRASAAPLVVRDQSWGSGVRALALRLDDLHALQLTAVASGLTVREDSRSRGATYDVDVLDEPEPPSPAEAARRVLEPWLASVPLAAEGDAR